MVRAWLAVLLAAACGGGESTTPDAPPIDTPPDVVVFPGCAEFSAPSVGVPTRITSTLGNADVESPLSCAEVEAPFGIESAGPDRVVPLRNLVAGTAYIVRLTSQSDLAFYVATGCSTARGPAANECLLFEDETSTGETGRFVATDTTAFVVIDYWESLPPSSLDFTLDVYAEACTGPAQCGGGTPACFEGQCVECESSFDCTSPLEPVCNAAQACTVGADACTTDDADEPANDGPAGGATIVPDNLGRSVITGKICSTPSTERDYFAFEVTTLGEAWDLTLAWTGPRDLDLAVYAANGTRMGMSFWEQPETMRLTYLPLGTYYVWIREFASDPAPVSYTLTTQRTFGMACTSPADCAAEYRNQIYRGNCLAGSCVSINGAGTLVEGDVCDSQSDCVPGLSCPSFFFTSDADTRESCARTCLNDGDCTPLVGGEFVCTTYFISNFCIRKCTEDDHCLTAIAVDPVTGPWSRMRCDVPTGRCLP